MLDVDVKVHDFVYFMIDEQTSGANSKERQGRYLPPTRGQDEKSLHIIYAAATNTDDYTV